MAWHCSAVWFSHVCHQTLPASVTTLWWSRAFAGVCLLGIGFLLSYQICATYYQRLVVHNLPAREMIISSFLPVGPMAMTAW
jgi:hypothetical protein